MQGQKTRQNAEADTADLEDMQRLSVEANKKSQKTGGRTQREPEQNAP